MVSFVSVEYLKIAGYIVSGFVAARAWFAKEIRTGRALIAHWENQAKAVESTVKADVKAVETKVEAEVKVVENKL